MNKPRGKLALVPTPPLKLTAEERPIWVGFVIASIPVVCIDDSLDEDRETDAIKAAATALADKLIAAYRTRSE